MKKLRFWLTVTAVIAVMITLVSCGENRLQAPTGLEIDDSFVLKWNKDDNARSYVVGVTYLGSANETEEEHISRKGSFSLSKLEEGDYRVRVYSVSGNRKLKNSKWSSYIEFHKDYDSGCVYKLINSGTEYEVSDDINVTGFVRLDDTYKGKPITAIGDGAFKANSKITGIRLGEKIKTIGNDSFRNCSNLTEIVIPDSVETIGNTAFQFCRSLKKVTMGKNVESVGEYAFAYCRELSDITVSPTLVTIGNFAFNECSAIKNIVLPDSVSEMGKDTFSGNISLESVTLGSGITELPHRCFNLCEALKEVRFSDNSQIKKIGNSVFEGCTSLTEINIPEDVTEIGMGAFYSAEKLASVTVPDSVVKIGSNAFDGTKLYNDQSENGDGIIYAGNWITAITDTLRNELQGLGVNATETLKTVVPFKDGTVGIAVGSFSDCIKLEKVDIPSGVKYLCDYAFNECPSLSNVTVRNAGVEDIGIGAFMDCIQLTRVNYGDSVKRIGSYSFSGCSILRTVTIPESVESIGTGAFYDTALWNNPLDRSDAVDEDERYTLGLVYAGDWVVGFNNMVDTKIKLKKDTAGIGDYAFYKNEDIVSVSGADNCSYIGSGAFFKCSNLATISLSRTLDRIDDYAFYGCSSLHHLTMPPKLKYVGRSAFYKCTALREADFFETELEHIGMYAFFGCDNMIRVSFSQGLKNIEDYAFARCTEIVDVTFYDSLETIGEKAFAYDTKLDSVKFGNSVKTIGASAFKGDTGLIEIILPDSIESIGYKAFANCEALKKADLGKGLEKIGEYAFYGDTELTDIAFSENIQSIGKYAFRGCSGLEAVIIGNHIKEIDKHAFYGCANATFYLEKGFDDKSEGISLRWNSSYRPTVRNCTLSEDRSTVVSIDVDGNTFVNFNKKRVAASPMVQNGYVFIGWSTNGNADFAEFRMNEVQNAPKDTKIYALIKHASEVDPSWLETDEEEQVTKEQETTTASQTD